MKYLVLCSLNFLFFINTVYSMVTIQPRYDNASQQAVVFNEKKAFELQCNVTTDAGSTDSVVVEWTKNDKLVSQIDDLKKRIKESGPGKADKSYRLKVDDSKYNDSGIYQCIVKTKTADGEQTQSAKFIVSSSIDVKVPSNLNVVEEEKLRLHCQVLGNPPPILSWKFRNDTDDPVERDLVESLNDTRIKFENFTEDGVVVPNAVLVIEGVQKSDRGHYTCMGVGQQADLMRNSTCYVRVTDKYAALWPFIGICAEVIILCAIIIIYEKKRNKTELEESDTDQSPDQKNTPDNGKESNLRHRQ